MPRHWTITRSTVATSDGQPRWDTVYQLLLRWGPPLPHDDTTVVLPVQEEDHECSLVCTRLDHIPTTATND